MESLIIFGAKYLVFLSPIIAAVFLYRSAPELRRQIVRFGIFSLPLTYLLGLAGRALYENPRPFVVEGFEPMIWHAADNGFPSDHLLLLSALAALVYVFNRKWSLPLSIIAVLVGISRMYAGVHHFADILGSILIALISAGLVYFVLNREKKV